MEKCREEINFQGDGSEWYYSNNKAVVYSSQFWLHLHGIIGMLVVRDLWRTLAHSQAEVRTASIRQSHCYSDLHFISKVAGSTIPLYGRIYSFRTILFSCLRSFLGLNLTPSRCNLGSLPSWTWRFFFILLNHKEILSWLILAFFSRGDQYAPCFCSVTGDVTNLQH